MTQENQEASASGPDSFGTARGIGVAGATAIVVGSMLGVGIFLTPPLVARSTGDPALFLLLWALGGLVAIAGATTYGELGAMMPRAGGDYVYIRRAFGASTGFAAGWVLFAGVFAGSIASMTVGVCRHQLSLLASGLAVDLSAPWLAVPSLGFRLEGVDVVAVGLVVLFTTVNALGVRLTTIAQSLLTMGPLALLGVFAIFVLASGPHAGAVASVTGERGTDDLSAALLGIYFTYAGWNSVAYVGGEVRDPGRNLPRALLGGTLVVTALYLLLCGAWLSLLGLGGIASSFEAGTASARALLGTGAEAPVAVLIALALCGAINATVLGGARIAYAMGRDRGLPEWLGHLDPRTGVPTRALWLQAGFAALLVVTGTFVQLVQLASIAMLLLGSLAVAALFALRRREPEAPRPYRATLYPLLPLGYLGTALAVVAVQIDAAVEGDGASSWFPLLGLAIFAAVWALHRARA
ncbi:MAG: amino acid permease [Deltaproteobacteria bacterium]|nr:amino acid permease [Deltaproteobacteria bacterium]